MQRYCWPGYELQLLGELQRQQLSAQFCDTLLQTEGISVPAHSCVLAALSPYLSQKLSTSLPPFGQKHHLQLQAVKAQTLLKLVGLLYSGEMEVNGSTERNDVLAVVNRFGIANLVEGQKDRGMKEAELQKKKSPQGCRENRIYVEETKGKDRRRKMQDAQVQTRRLDPDSSVEKRMCISTGTQTVDTVIHTVDVSFSSHMTPPASESTPSVAQGLDFSLILKPQSKTPDQLFCSTSCSGISSMPPEALSKGRSGLNRSYYSLINPTSTLTLSNLPFSLNDDSVSQRSQEQSSEFGDSTQDLGEERTKLKSQKRDGIHNRGDVEQPSQENGDEMPGEERGMYPEKGHAHGSLGKKSLAKMKRLQQIMKATEISIKVKLRRRRRKKTKGEMWEVVNMQNTDEVSVPVLLKQPPSSNVQLRPVQRPDSLILHPAVTSPPESPPGPSTFSQSQPLSSGGFTSNQSNGLEATRFLQHQGSVAESDEQIEKLLEDDAMRDLNKPSLESDNKKSLYLQPSHDIAPAVFQIPVLQNDAKHSQMHAANSTAGCVFYPDMDTQSYKSSSDTDAALIQHQLECFQQNPPSVTPTWQREEMSLQSMQLSRSQECRQPASQIRSVTSPGFFSAGQFLPLNNDIHPLCLPYMDDLRLPPCFSPLELHTSITTHQSAVNNTTNLGVKIQQEPFQHGRPWLTETPGTLQFPLSGNSQRKKEKKSLSVPQDTNYSSWSKLQAQNEGNWEKPHPPKEAEGQQNAAEMNSHIRKMKIVDITGDVVAPKRRKARCTRHPEDSAGSVLAHKGDNVLVKEREMASSSLNIASKFAGKPNQLSSFSESLRVKDGPSGGKSDLTPIRTRCHMTGESYDTNPELPLFPTPPTHIVKTMTKQQITSQKRRRQTKTVPQDFSLPTNNPVVEKTNRNKESQREIANSFLKQDLQYGEVTQQRCKKRRMYRRTEVAVIPLKKALSVESIDEPEIVPETGKLESPKWSQMVLLKKLQNLIKRKHSKLRKSRESQGTSGAVGDDVQRGKSNRYSACEDSTKKITSQVTVDINHNLISNKNIELQPDDAIPKYTYQERSMFGKARALFSFETSEEEVAKAAAEREQPLEKSDGAWTDSDTGESDTAQQIIVIDEDSSDRDTHLPLEIKLPSDHNLHAKTHLSAPGGISRTADCNEEEEEVEVDVLLCSPVKVPQTTESEGGHNNTDVTPDNEAEDEDMNEIDVTGDEAD